jgi:hypothetical protein
MVKVVEEKRNESCWGSDIEESDDDGSEMERSDSGSISLHSHGSAHARGGFNFFFFLHNSSVNNHLSKWIGIFVAFYHRAERLLKRHRRKVHNFRGHGPQGQPRRPRKDSISASSISSSSGARSIYRPYEYPAPPSQPRHTRKGSISISSIYSSSGARSLYVPYEPPGAAIETEFSECGKFFPSMNLIKQHRRPPHQNAPASSCEGAVPVPSGMSN